MGRGFDQEDRVKSLGDCSARLIPPSESIQPTTGTRSSTTAKATHTGVDIRHARNAPIRTR